MSTFCSNCGSALPPTARLCSVCGSVVSGFPPAGYPPYAPRLVRPFHGRQFAGVCAAFARTYGWDLGLVRILTVIAGIFVFPLPEISGTFASIVAPSENVIDPVGGPLIGDVLVTVAVKVTGWLNAEGFSEDAIVVDVCWFSTVNASAALLGAK